LRRVRIALVSVDRDNPIAEALRDLGCAAREHGPLAPPGEVVRGADALVVDGADDLDLARFILDRCRAADPRLPTLLVLSTSQLGRLEPAWPFDDFILRGCSPHELYKRLRVIEWRASEFAHAERVKIGELVIDSAAHEVLLSGRRIPMAPMEFTLLSYLARNRDRVVERAALLREVWGVRVAQTRTVDVHVQRLRAKLAPSVGIETVRGVGYRLVTGRGAGAAAEEESSV
jgi:DNA-binding winged helix-turn-helix (wHTH) protein